MNQTIRTSIFAGVALLSVAIGFATRSAYTPADLADFSDVGTQFFPEFTDPNEATGLRVVSFNEDTGQTDQFSVEFKDGLWRIPSHHDYPADGKDQLAKTAASMIGVERSALVERSKAAHKRYDLLDPLDSEVSGTEGRGDRITLTKGDVVLADFIVGKKVEGQENVYYVRSAGEERLYTADLGDFKISTKFADWIQKDILDINRNDVRELFIDRYHVDEASGQIVPGDQITLNRDSGTAEWKLEDLNAETEKVNTSNISSMLLALDDLAIVGVRTKPEGLSAGLKSEEGGIKANPLEYQLIRADLQKRGFFLVPQLGIVSNEGEVHVGTSDGVLYVLRFGEEFSGTDVDIEVGRSGKANETTVAENSETDAEKPNEDSESDGNPEDEKSDGLKKSRYLFVSTQFDENLLGGKPTAPVKPEPPAEAETTATDDAATTIAAVDDAATTDVAGQENSDDAEQKADEVKPDPEAEYKQALAKYEEDLEVFKIAEQKYKDNLEKGKKRVGELNKRFADWYYVISADVFDRMKLNRADIVSPNDPPKENPADAASPGNPPETAPAVETPPVTDAPAADGSAPGEPANEGDNSTPDKDSTPSASEKPTEPAEPTTESGEEPQPEPPSADDPPAVEAGDADPPTTPETEETAIEADPAPQ